jgi:hypothetical protein
MYIIMKSCKYGRNETTKKCNKKPATTRKCKYGRNETTKKCNRKLSKKTKQETPVNRDLVIELEEEKKKIIVRIQTLRESVQPFLDKKGSKPGAGIFTHIKDILLDIDSLFDLDIIYNFGKRAFLLRKLSYERHNQNLPSKSSNWKDIDEYLEDLKDNLNADWRYFEYVLSLSDAELVKQNKKYQKMIDEDEDMW